MKVDPNRRVLGYGSSREIDSGASVTQRQVAADCCTVVNQKRYFSVELSGFHKLALFASRLICGSGLVLGDSEVEVVIVVRMGCGIWSLAGQ